MAKGSMTVAAALMAGVLGASVAQGRELPRANADKRPTGCESFGPDFRKIDGTETCIRISGSVRAETTVTTTGGGGFWSRR